MSKLFWCLLTATAIVNASAADKKIILIAGKETMMWACERPDGGRGFGWTGGHHHKNWGNDNHRKVVLNAILWLAKVEVPPDGIKSSVTADDVSQNLDPKRAN